MKMSKRMKLATDIATYVLIAIVFLFSIIFLSMSLTSKNGNDIPKLFGVSVLKVETSSMAGGISGTDVTDFYQGVDMSKIDKGNILENDLITIRRISGEESRTLAIGTIITYKYYNKELGGNIFNTHRIVGIDIREGNQVYYKTKGDNNLYVDSQGEVEGYTPLPSIDIIGVYTGKVPVVGRLIVFLMSGLGFVLFIIVPLSLFFLYRVYVLVRVIVQIQVEKTKTLANTTSDDYSKLLLEIEQLRAKVGSDARPQSKTALDTPSSDTDIAIDNNESNPK